MCMLLLHACTRAFTHPGLTACPVVMPTTGSAAAGQPETPSAQAEHGTKAKGKGKLMPPVKLAQEGAAEGAAEGGPAAAAAAAGHQAGVDALLQQAGFIKRIDSMSYGIAQSEMGGRT